MELFDLAGLNWPPLAVNTTVCSAGYTVSYAALSLRQVEVVAFLHAIYPPPPDFRGAEFVDANMSLGQILRFKTGDAEIRKTTPWAVDHLKTIVGSARMVARATSESHRCVRAVDAIEYMQIIGWDRSMWRAGGDMPNLDLCSELAGNAFAGFAVGPLLSAAFASFGHNLLLSEGV